MKQTSPSLSKVRPAAYWATLSSSLCINSAMFISAFNVHEATPSPEFIYKASQPFALAILPVLAAVVSRKAQDVIAHFRIKHALPACRALKLAALDPRVDMAAIKKVGRIPPIGSKQNAWWYTEFYQKFKHTPEIVLAQRRYLQFRDLAFIQGLVTLLFGFTAMLYGGPLWWGLLISVGSYAAFVLSTRNRGEQFVQTAMALKEH